MTEKLKIRRYSKERRCRVPQSQTKIKISTKQRTKQRTKRRTKHRTKTSQTKVRRKKQNQSNDVSLVVAKRNLLSHRRVLHVNVKCIFVQNIGMRKTIHVRLISKVQIKKSSRRLY